MWVGVDLGPQCKTALLLWGNGFHGWDYAGCSCREAHRAPVLGRSVSWNQMVSFSFEMLSLHPAVPRIQGTACSSLSGLEHLGDRPCARHGLCCRLSVTVTSSQGGDKTPAPSSQRGMRPACPEFLPCHCDSLQFPSDT